MSDVRSQLKKPIMTVPLLGIGVLTILKLCESYVVRTMDENSNPMLIACVLQLIIFILPCIFYYLLKGRRLETDPFFTMIRPSHLFFVIVSALVLLTGTLLAKYGQYIIFDGIYASGGLMDSAAAVEDNSTGVLIAYVIIPALSEELLCRGVILSEYRPYGSVNAVVISAVIFAFLHFSFENFLVYFFAGIILGMVTVVTRSILASVILHMLTNILSIYGSDSFLRITIQKCGEFFMGFLLTALFGLAVVMLLSRLEQVYSDYAEKPPIGSLPASSKDHVLKVFFSPAFLVLVAVFVGLTVMN